MSGFENRSSHGLFSFYFAAILGLVILACFPLTSLGQSSGSPRWSPDSQRIAFDFNIGGHPQIYTVNSHGGQPRRFTESPGTCACQTEKNSEWRASSSMKVERYITQSKRPRA